ncbi:hypothetical protein Hanom_Chr07g00640791 [Helianthus anomalus]
MFPPSSFKFIVYILPISMRKNSIPGFSINLSPKRKSQVSCTNSSIIFKSIDEQ